MSKDDIFLSKIKNEVREERKIALRALRAFEAKKRVKKEALEADLETVRKRLIRLKSALNPINKHLSALKKKERDLSEKRKNLLRFN